MNPYFQNARLVYKSNCAWCHTRHWEGVYFEGYDICCNCHILLDPTLVQRKCSDCEETYTKFCTYCKEYRCLSVGVLYSDPEILVCCECFTKAFADGCSVRCRLCWSRFLEKSRRHLIYLFHGLYCDTPILEAAWHSLQPNQISKVSMLSPLLNNTLRQIRQLDYTRHVSSKETQIGDEVAQLARTFYSGGNYFKTEVISIGDTVILSLLVDSLSYFHRHAERILSNQSCSPPSWSFWNHSMDVLNTVHPLVESFPEEIKERFESWSKRLRAIKPEPTAVETIFEEPPLGL